MHYIVQKGIKVSNLHCTSLTDALLLFLVGPLQHHVVEGHNRSRSVSSEVAIELLSGKAVVEAVDDVVVDDVGDGGARVEESRKV